MDRVDSPISTRSQSTGGPLVQGDLAAQFRDDVHRFVLAGAAALRGTEQRCRPQSTPVLRRGVACIGPPSAVHEQVTALNMTEFTKTKIHFVLALLASLFALHPFLARFEDSGFLYWDTI
jgi:hypothetical protein